MATFPRFNWPYDSPRQLTLCVVGGSASGTNTMLVKFLIKKGEEKGEGKGEKGGKEEKEEKEKRKKKRKEETF